MLQGIHNLHNKSVLGGWGYHPRHLKRRRLEGSLLGGHSTFGARSPFNAPDLRGSPLGGQHGGSGGCERKGVEGTVREQKGTRGVAGIVRETEVPKAKPIMRKTIIMLPKPRQRKWCQGNQYARAAHVLGMLGRNTCARQVTPTPCNRLGARIGQSALTHTVATGHHAIIASKGNCLDIRLCIGAGAGSAYLA